MTGAATSIDTAGVTKALPARSQPRLTFALVREAKLARCNFQLDDTQAMGQVTLNVLTVYGDMHLDRS